VTSLSRM